MNSLNLDVLQNPGNLKLEISARDLESVIAGAIKDITDQVKAWMRNERGTELIPRKEAMSLLDVKTNLTMLRWEEKGFLKPRRIGKRVFYDKTEIMDAVEEFERHPIR